MYKIFTLSFLLKCIIYAATHEIFTSDSDFQSVPVGDRLPKVVIGGCSAIAAWRIWVQTPGEVWPTWRLDPYPWGSS